MVDKGSIRAVNLRIRDFVDQSGKTSCGDFSQNLAKARFCAKFEEPRSDTSSARKQNAWDRWISFDEGLPKEGILGPYWAKARLWLGELLSDFRMGELTFTNGSSFEPLRDRVSVACKLSETWTITDDCFDTFSWYAYWHRALRSSVKKRFRSHCIKHRWNEKVINRKLWIRFSNSKEPNFQIFKFKLFCSVQFVGGNRWSTVPKNNSKDRPICLEPLCNMLVQRAVGLGLRKCLRDKCGIDLDTLADVHRDRIRDRNIATIDLTDCSDAVSMRLINYLLPKRVLSKVLACRSDMTLGPDDNFYVVNKVSSMGNGFTFDLMTAVLTALTRSFDPTSTVFGDDIIIENQYAEDLVSNLQIAGFVVNVDKTFIRSSYRESCGAHFVDGVGYLTVFDQRWLKSDHDLIVTMNKVAILSLVYGEPFETLRAEIWSCVPPSLLGATVSRLTVNTNRPPSYQLDEYVRYGPIVYIEPQRSLLKLLRRCMRRFNKSGRISIARAVTSSQQRAPNSLRSDQWDVFFQYIRSGRLSRKIPRLVIKSTLVARVDEEQIGLISALPLREKGE